MVGCVKSGVCSSSYGRVGLALLPLSWQCWAHAVLIAICSRHLRANSASRLALTHTFAKAQVSCEPRDEYVARMGAMARFYGALMQCDDPQNPHGLKQAWTWLAR